jgi:hypothetical protein
MARPERAIFLLHRPNDEVVITIDRPSRIADMQGIGRGGALSHEASDEGTHLIGGLAGDGRLIQGGDIAIGPAHGTRAQADGRRPCALCYPAV